MMAGPRNRRMKNPMSSGGEVVATPTFCVKEIPEEATDVFMPEGIFHSNRVEVARAWMGVIPIKEAARLMNDAFIAGSVHARNAEKDLAGFSDDPHMAQLWFI